MSPERFSERFVEFFRAVHDDADPFPWQTRLARRLCDSHEWPRIIDLPTGSGKTACIDIAIFHFLAAIAEGRTGVAPRRIAFVVDRRVIVDEASERARKIANAIATSTVDVLKEAARLLETATGSRCVEVFTLRGGVPKERNLVRDPRSASVVLSTVDQIGSRLLFRGYGVRDNVKSMHAGLFGFDTLLLLDEAHIAEPFLQTLEGIRREQGRSQVSPAEGLGVRPLWYTQLSATPAGKAEFELDAEDRAHPVLRLRLEGAKPMRLLEVAKRDDLTKELASLVTSSLAERSEDFGEKARIGVVVNRISTARDLKNVLTRTLKESVEVHLLIGQVRSLDRDAVMRKLAPKLKSSSKPRQGEKPIVVVATQTIEVGADFDFHTMFIEAASYPAIRQRLGRLNRLGLRERAGGAVVLVKAGKEDDPVYGSAIDATWRFLQEHAEAGIVRLGIAEAPTPSNPAALMPIPVSTPFLTPAALGLFSQTSPRPESEPDVADYLHGFAQQLPDVTVVWRDGLYTGREAIPIPSELAKSILEALPPLATESMNLPLSSVRDWLRGDVKKLDELGDFEGEPASESKAEDKREQRDPFIFAIDDDDVRQIRVSQIRPGMTVVVSTTMGGNNKQSGFDPTSEERAEDLSLEARSCQDRRPTLVLTSAMLDAWKATSGTNATLSIQGILESVECEELDDHDLSSALVEWFAGNSDHLPAPVKSTFESLSRKPDGSIADFDVEQLSVEGLILRARRARTADLIDDRYGLQRTVNVELDDHLKGVAEYAERFARAVGLPEELVRALRIAGRVHDLGKADPRFQAMLGRAPTHDGEQKLLAKGRRIDGRVRLGARQECYSVAFLDQYPELYQGTAERELVRYLVGTHHGHGRGLQRMTLDRGTRFSVSVDGKRFSFNGKPALDSLESGWPELFRGLEKRFGAWGLAYLETILRLADHRRSEQEVTEASA